MTHPDPILAYVAPDEGKALRVGPFGFLFKTGRASGSGYTLAEVTVPAGATSALHRHPCEETMYLLAGQLDFFGDDGAHRRLAAGDVVHVASRVGHGYTNVGEAAARLLVIAPVAQEALFDDLAGTAGDPTRIATVFARHGVVAGGR